MTHDPSYVATLTSEEQIKQDFVTGKGNATHVTLLVTSAYAEIRINSVSEERYIDPCSLSLSTTAKTEGLSLSVDFGHQGHAI